MALDLITLTEPPLSPFHPFSGILDAAFTLRSDSMMFKYALMASFDLYN